MKTFRKMTSAALLACVLTVSANAGEMHAPGATPPPPQQPTAASYGVTEEAGVSNTPGNNAPSTLDVLASLLNGLLTVF